MFWNFFTSSKYSGTAGRRALQSGFGLIELMISISIVVLVSSIVFARQGSFDNAVLLRNQAYEIALQTRSVQLSAVSVVGDGTSNFQSVLGLYFNKTAGNEQGYAIFRDNNGDDFYNANELFGEQGIIDPRFYIKDILLNGVTSINDISVVYERPNFDARFISASGDTGASKVEIQIARVGTPTAFRTVEITSTGQVSVLAN